MRFKEFLKEEKIASYKTIKNIKIIRINYAIDAMERDSMSGDPAQVKRADKAFDDLRDKKIKPDELMYYALRQKEFMELHD